MSSFLGRPAPAAAPALDFPKPLSAQDERASPELFGILNFILGFAPTHPSEKALMARFAKLDIGAGKTFDFASLSPELQQAVKDGIADAWRANEATKTLLDTHQLSSGDIFGTRAYLKNNYQYRMTAAVLGIYRMPESLLVANPIHRYLINSPMLPQLTRDADGGLTIYLQNISPGADKEPNWLPAPEGPFVAAMRLYWPRKEALSGQWQAPQLQRVN